MDQVTLLLLSGTATYLVSHYVLSAEAWRKHYTSHGIAAHISQARGVVARRISSGMWLFLSPLALLFAAQKPLLDYGLRTGQFTSGIGWAALAAVVVIPVVVLSARKPAMQSFYPEIRLQTMTPYWLSLSAVSWMIYLLGYEFFFRGFLLFLCQEQWGLEAAVGITTALYTLAHLHKPASEAFSCIPMGIGFGYLAWVSGGCWAPWLLHLAIALSSEIASTYLNPKFTWWHQRPIGIGATSHADKPTSVSAK